MSAFSASATPMVPQWKDVTSMLRAAAAEMTNKDPMVHIETFSLLDSMSAVEIMDPIMDQCCGVTGSMKMEDLLTVHYPADRITASTAVKLFQSLFIYEAAFLDGASLMESINQCMFSWEGTWAVQRERAAISAVDAAVLAYCQSVVFGTSCQFKAVMAADIYEDEDFQAGHRSYLSDASLQDAELSAALTTAVAALQAQASASSAPEDAYLVALLQVRLQLQTFYRELGQWVHGTVQEYSRLIKQRNANNAAAVAQSEKRNAAAAEGKAAEDGAAAGDNSVQQAFEGSVRAAKKRSHESCVKITKIAQATVTALQGLLDMHKKGSTGVGADSESGSTGSVFSDIPHPTKCPDIAFALSSKLVKFHQTGPIRRVEMKPYLASVSFVQDICREVVEISGAIMSFFEMPTVSTVAQAIAATPAPGSLLQPGILTFDHLLHTSLHVSSARLHLLTRSYYLAVLYVFSVEMNALMWASLYSKGLPKALVESELVTVHWVGGNPSAAAWDTLKGLTVCRSRLLASRLQNMIDLWSHVSSEAIYIDNRFHSDISAGAGDEATLQTQQLQWSSLWALQYTVQVMDLYMALMVEMDIIGVEEWDYFYWYWDYLCSTGVFTAEKLRTQRFHLDVEMYEAAKLDAARAKSAQDSAAAKKTGKKKGKGGVESKIAETSAPLVAPVLMPPSREELLMKGRGMLCRGVYRMCALAGTTSTVGLGTKASGEPLIDKDEGRWSNWEVKFHHRFLPFAELSNPPTLTYGDFLRATGQGAPAAAAEGGATAAGSSSGSSGSAVAAPRVRDAAVLGNLVQGATICFQNARKVFDEARIGTLSGGALATEGANRYAMSSVVSLTKVSVASALSAMKAAQLVKALPAKPAPDQEAAYALRVNKGYNRHFAVVEISAAEAAV